MGEMMFDEIQAGLEGTDSELDSTNEAGQEKSAELPEDHPLVKALAAQKAEIKGLKAKARRLDEIEEAQKSESEKSADRLAAAEAEVAAIPQKVAEELRGHLVELHSISDEDAELFLTATTPDLLIKQVSRLVQQSDTPRAPKPNLQQGNPSKARGGSLSAGRERFAAQNSK